MNRIIVCIVLSIIGNNDCYANKILINRTGTDSPDLESASRFVFRYEPNNTLKDLDTRSRVTENTKANVPQEVLDRIFGTKPTITVPDADSTINDKEADTTKRRNTTGPAFKSDDRFFSETMVLTAWLGNVQEENTKSPTMVASRDIKEIKLLHLEPQSTQNNSLSTEYLKPESEQRSVSQKKHTPHYNASSSNVISSFLILTVVIYFSLSIK